MARRRCLITRRVAVLLGGCLLLGLGLVGMVSLANQVINLREDIAELEDRREFLKACQASLLADWIAARSPEVITARAQRELGLVLADDPDLALVRISPDGQDQGRRWRHLLDGLGGGQMAWADAGQAGRETGTSTSGTRERRSHE